MFPGIGPVELVEEENDGTVLLGTRVTFFSLRREDRFFVLSS